MEKLIELNFRPDDGTLRRFGFMALFAFGALSLLAFHEAGAFRFGLGAARVPVATLLGCIGVWSGVCALVFPQANRPVYVALSVATYPIGLVVSHVMMAILFFGVFGVVSLLVRLRGRDPLARAYDRRAEGYWTVRTAPRSKSDYFRQF